LLSGKVEGLSALKDSELGTVRSDHADIAEAEDSFVDGRARIGPGISAKASYVRATSVFMDAWIKDSV